MTTAFIKGIAYYLPERIVTNEELIQDFPEWSVEKVTAKVGINKRHIAGANETAGDMGIKAAQKLFRDYKIAPDQIDYILFCTQSPDYVLPTTACIMQHELGIPTTAGALDFNLGCSGYIYGLSLAKGLLCAGIARNILLITAETYSKYIHPQDRGNRSIFGDAATATLISDEGFAEIENFSLGTDGRGAANLIVRTGAAKEPQVQNDLSVDEGGYPISSDHLYMNGSEIFNFTLEAVPVLVQDILQKNQTTSAEVDLFVFHQANKFMLNTLRKVCGIDKEKFYLDLEEVGNTVSSTVPIALKDALPSIPRPANVLIAGFGVGYSWGGCLLHFNS